MGKKRPKRAPTALLEPISRHLAANLKDGGGGRRGDNRGVNRGGGYED